MPTPCPDPAVLSAYQAGVLEPAPRQAFEAHVRSCRPCRDTFLLVATLEEEAALPVEGGILGRLIGLRPAVPFRLPSRRLAAAALLLIALGAGWMVLEHSRRSPGPSVGGAVKDRAVSSSRELPQGRIESGASPRACLASGVDLLLDRGARLVREGPGRFLRAEAGTFWLEVSRGEGVTLGLPQATLSLSRGTLAASLPQPRPTAWQGLLGEAVAAAQDQDDGDVAAQVWILEGEAVLTWEGRVSPLHAGSRWQWTASRGWRETAVSAQEMEALWGRRAEAAAALPGRLLLPEATLLGKAKPGIQVPGQAPRTYRWVSVLSGRTPQAEVRFTLPAGGAWYDWTAGLAGRPLSAREVVEVAWDGERLTTRVNGRAFFSVAQGQFDKELVRSPKQAWGISVWGDSVTVARSVLLEGEGL